MNTCKTWKKKSGVERRRKQIEYKGKEDKPPQRKKKKKKKEGYEKEWMLEKRNVDHPFYPFHFILFFDHLQTETITKKKKKRQE